MEILNNLWNAVSNPNEELLNIITVPLFFIEAYLTMNLFLYILGLSSNKKQRIFYVLGIATMGFLTMFIIPNPYNVFVNYFMTILLQCVIFKNPVVKSIVSGVLSIVVYNLIGICLLNPYITLLHISTEQLNMIPIYRILYLIVIYVITTLLILIFKYKKFTIYLLEEIDKKTKIIIVLNLLLGILAIITQSIILFYYVDSLPIIITFLSFISLVLYFSISIYSLTRIFKLVLTTRKLQSAEEYNNTLRILHENVSEFKHDFDNIITTIGGFIQTNDMEGLKKYYSELEEDCQTDNNLYILNPNIVNNDGIYNLITKKYHRAESEKIKMNITFLLNLATLHMPIYEFARILGILLDNAIEASSECKNKIVNLIFREDQKNFRQLIIVENTYNNKNVDTEKIYEKGITEKENHTGLGLWKVRKIIKKHNNINLHTSKNKTYFSQQLEIY